jgi:hypothetical protein
VALRSFTLLKSNALFSVWAQKAQSNEAQEPKWDEPNVSVVQRAKRAVAGSKWGEEKIPNYSQLTMLAVVAECADCDFTKMQNMQ